MTIDEMKQWLEQTAGQVVEIYWDGVLGQEWHIGVVEGVFPDGAVGDYVRIVQSRIPKVPDMYNGLALTGIVRVRTIGTGKWHHIEGRDGLVAPEKV